MWGNLCALHNTTTTLYVFGDGQMLSAAICQRGQILNVSSTRFASQQITFLLFCTCQRNRVVDHLTLTPSCRVNSRKGADIKWTQHFLWCGKSKELLKDLEGLETLMAYWSGRSGISASFFHFFLDFSLNFYLYVTAGRKWGKFSSYPTPNHPALKPIYRGRFLHP